MKQQNEELKDKIKALMRALHWEHPEKYPDNCSRCKGEYGGVRGNESISIVNEKVLCDYCSCREDEKETE